MNFVVIKDIRKRLLKLIDNVLQQYNNNQLFTINQARLQQWCDFLHSMIISKAQSVQKQDYQLKNIKLKLNNKKKLLKLENLSTNQIKIDMYKSIHKNLQKLLYLQDKKITIIIKNSQKLLQIQHQSIKKFASVTAIDIENYIIAGGCKKNNKKSDQILLFNTKTLNLSLISHLPEGISSHGSILLNEKLYFVGGNKEEGVITRNCSVLNLSLRNVEQITPLNYPTTSLCLINWKGSYIYKVGGIGQCFGQNNISPYIERYHVQLDEWEIINPKLKGQLQNIFRMFAHSIGYISNNNQLIVFGGFDINKKPTNFGFKMKIHDDSQYCQIRQCGYVSIKEGGFLSNNYITTQTHLFIIQTQVTPKIVHILISVPLLN